MYQNGFLDGLLNTPVLLSYASPPKIGEDSEMSKDEYLQAISEGKVAYEMQKSATVFFYLEAYDEVGIKGYFTDSSGQKESSSRFISWGAVISIE